MTELELMARLLGFASVLQSVELIKLKDAWADDGVWSWQVLREDQGSFPRPLLPIFDHVFDEKGFEILLWLRATFSLGLGLGSGSFGLALIVFLGTWLCAVRWRGTFNGGSDSMTAQIALALTVARLIPTHIFEYFALLFVAVQVTASYTVAGISKYRNPAWRTGAALPQLFTLPGYDSPPQWLKTLLAKPDMARKLSLGILGFECLFPLAWIHPWVSTLFLAAGLVFHLVCYQVLGLNRFVWAWLAAYPALMGVVESFYGK